MLLRPFTLSGWPIAVACAVFVTIAAESRAQSSVNLEQATLEDLMNMEVTSASKKEQALFRTEAAVHVLTSEDIRRSCATSIPDALRLVPGLQVATIDASKWAISARGFNSLWSNKLLVLVDGRSVYTPVSSGVHWDLLDLMLVDIERIEVVRGPGASVWGANAVNGVINIISKAAVSTQGGVLSIGTGSLTPGIGAFRYGGRAGSRGYYRVFGKHAERSSMEDDLGANAGDAWHASSAGFRLDLERGDADNWTLQGSLLGGAIGHRVIENMTSYAPAERAVIQARSPTMAGNLLARWTRRPSADSHLSVQASWDRTSRQVINANWFNSHFHDIGDAPGALDFADRDPSHQLRLRSQLNLRHSWQLDAAWTYVARLNGIEVPAYTRVAARIGGTIAGLAISLSGHNLLNSTHLEFGGYEGFYQSRVPRSWVASATWAF